MSTYQALQLMIDFLQCIITLLIAFSIETKK
jgi:hypothetical protein